MNKLKYTDILLIPTLVLIVISACLYLNIGSINSAETSLSELPTTEIFTEKLSNPNNSLTKDELVGYANRLLTLVKKGYTNNIKTLNTITYILIFVFVMSLVWLITSIKIYKKIIQLNESSNK